MPKSMRVDLAIVGSQGRKQAVIVDCTSSSKTILMSCLMDRMIQHINAYISSLFWQEIVQIVGKKLISLHGVGHYFSLEYMVASPHVLRVVEPHWSKRKINHWGNYKMTKNTLIRLVATHLIEAGLINSDQESAIEQVLRPIAEKFILRPSQEAILEAAQNVALGEYCSEMPELPFEQLIEALEGGQSPCIPWELFEDYRAEDFARILRSACSNVTGEIEGLFVDSGLNDCPIVSH
jgi:hypothetical protein